MNMSRSVSLRDLPVEIIIRIIIFSDPRAALRLGAANTKFNGIVADSTVWRKYVSCAQTKWELNPRTNGILDIRKLSACLGDAIRLWAQFAVIDHDAFDYLKIIEKNWIDEAFLDDEEGRYSCPPLPQLLERHVHFLVLFNHPVLTNEKFAGNIAKRGLYTARSELTNSITHSLLFATTSLSVKAGALSPEEPLTELAIASLHRDCKTNPFRFSLHGSQVPLPNLRACGLVLATIRSALLSPKPGSALATLKAQGKLIIPPPLNRLPIYSEAFAKKVVQTLANTEKSKGDYQAFNHKNSQTRYRAAWAHCLIEQAAQLAEPANLNKTHDIPDNDDENRACEWAGYYTGWPLLVDPQAGPSDVVDPPMTRIFFEPGPSADRASNYYVKGTGQDSVGNFVLRGHMRFNGIGRLRKSYSTHAFALHVWHTGFGIIGFWTRPAGETRRSTDVAEGFVWMWKREWEEPGSNPSEVH